MSANKSESSFLYVTLPLYLVGLLVTVLSGPVILGWQAIRWLQTAEWVPMPMEKLVIWFGFDSMSWRGLATLPIALVLPVMGVLFIWLVMLLQWVADKITNE